MAPLTSKYLKIIIVCNRRRQYPLINYLDSFHPHASLAYCQVYRRLRFLAPFYLKHLSTIQLLQKHSGRVTCPCHQRNNSAHMLPKSMDNWHVMRTFFQKYPNSWLIWADGPNKLWGIWCILLLCVPSPWLSIYQPLFSTKTKLLIYLG